MHFLNNLFSKKNRHPSIQSDADRSYISFPQPLPFGVIQREREVVKECFRNAKDRTDIYKSEADPLVETFCRDI